MRSPFARLPGETPPPIGHNQGPPLEPGRSWRRHAWTVARAELMPKLPLEIVRRRVRRARELGLAYPQYASILMGTGRDVVGFLFTCDAIGMRLERALELPQDRAERLREISGCDRLLLTGHADDAPAIARALATTHRIPLAGAGAGPAPGAPPREGRAAVRALLDPLKLPSDAVVMIGTRAEERAMADAARLAKFLPAEGYFEPGG